VELVRQRKKYGIGRRRLAAAALALAALAVAAGSAATAAAAAKKAPVREQPGTLATHPLGALVADELKLMVEKKPADLAELRDVVVAYAVQDYGVAQAVRDKLEKDPSFLERTGATRTKILAEHFYAKQIFEVSRPTPAEVDAAFGELAPLPLVYQIVNPAREEAEAARNRVLAGESFTDVARQVSTGLSAGYGGMIGYLLPRQGHHSPEEEQVIFSLKEGEVSAVTPGPLGFSVFWVKQIRSVEEQKRNGSEDLEKRLHSERLQRREKEVLDRLRGAAKIVINEKNLETPPVGNAPHPAVLAQVDDEYIFAAGFFEQSGGSGHGQGISFGLQDRTRLLTRAINNLLYRREALRLGLDKDQEVRKPLEKLRREHLWQVWLDKQGLKMKNRPKEMAALIESLKKKVSVREQELPGVLAQW
jgi:hypothetical protein